MLLAITQVIYLLLLFDMFQEVFNKFHYGFSHHQYRFFYSLFLDIMYKSANSSFLNQQDAVNH